MCTKSLHIHCILVCLTSLDSASFVIISFCSSFFIYKNNDIIRQYLCIYIQTDASSSILHQREEMTMTINKSYIHCMIYIETKNVHCVSHIRIRLDSQGLFVLCNKCQKNSFVTFVFKIEKVLINLYTMVISFLTLLSKLIMLIKQIVEQLCYIEFFSF